MELGTDVHEGCMGFMIRGKLNPKPNLRDTVLLGLVWGIGLIRLASLDRAQRSRPKPPGLLGEKAINTHGSVYSVWEDLKRNSSLP